MFDISRNQIGTFFTHGNLVKNNILWVWENFI